MSSSARRCVWAATLLVVAGSTLEAQSLADVARQEEARRKAIATPGKVYTNDTVRSEVPPTPAAVEPATTVADAPPAPGSAPSTTPADPKAGTTATAAGSSEAPAAAKQDAAYWQQRLTAARDGLSRAQMFAEALQSRINALTTDFTNRDDPAQRNVIARERDKAIAELDRVRKEIQDNTKAIAAIQEEGRRAGAPAGWLR